MRKKEDSFGPQLYMAEVITRWPCCFGPVGNSTWQKRKVEEASSPQPWKELRVPFEYMPQWLEVFFLPNSTSYNLNKQHHRMGHLGPVQQNVFTESAVCCCSTVFVCCDYCPEECELFDLYVPWIASPVCSDMNLYKEESNTTSSLFWFDETFHTAEYAELN